MVSYRERWIGVKIMLVMEMIIATPFTITVFQIAALIQLRTMNLYLMEKFPLCYMPKMVQQLGYKWGNQEMRV